MSIIYECLGKDEYQQEVVASDPWKRANTYNNSKIFRDIITYNHGMRFSPESLGITFPYPDYFTDTTGVVYRRVDDRPLDNHQFEQSGLEGPMMNFPNTMGETFIPKQVEKPQVVDNSGYEMSSTWHSLKQRGILGS